MKRRSILLALVASALASPFPNKLDNAPKGVRADAAIAPTTTERGVGVGVTEKIAPSAAPPAACTLNYNGVFAIAVVNITAKAAVSAAPELPKGAPIAAPSKVADVLAPGGVKASAAAAPASVAAATAKPAAVPQDEPIPKPSAGTPPADKDATVTLRSTKTQTRTVTVRRTVVGQTPKESGSQVKAAVKAYMISQIDDGQIQAPTKPTSLSMITVASPGVPKPSASAPAPAPAPGTTGAAPKPVASPTKAVSSVIAISEISDGQIQAPVVPAAKPAANVPAAAPAVASASPAAPPAAAAAGSMAPMAGMAGMSGMAGMNMVRRQAPGDSTQLVACKTPGTLQITLADGVLKDAKGRIGYIASNYQFQFDGPPQSGSIYTAGFSVCNNGSLALGGTTTWYQCRSGDFYNLYDRWWAPQCNPVTINAVMLKNC